MPAKSADTNSKTRTAKKSERLELATAISNLTAKQEAFTKAIDALEQFKADTLTNLDLQIDAKKIELLELEENYEHQCKNGQIETDQHLAEYKYNGAIGILKSVSETAIQIEELKQLRDEVEHLRQDRTNEIEEIKKTEKAARDKEMHSALSNMKLTHKAEVAESTATVTQQKKEIITLENAIKNLQHELAEQRKLTKDVAEAGRQGPVTVNSGK